MTPEAYKKKLNQLANIQRVLKEIDTVSDFNFLKLISSAPIDAISSTYPEYKATVKTALQLEETALKAELNA